MINDTQTTEQDIMAKTAHQMITRTINKSNWSGEEAEVSWQTQSVDHASHKETITLWPYGPDEDAFTLMLSQKEWPDGSRDLVAELYFAGQEGEYTIATGYGGGRGKRSEWMFVAGDVVRDDNCAAIAAMQMIFMLV